jgi:hypothetical protein
MNKEAPLINFPKTYAFISFAAAYIKGGQVSEWMEELKSYKIFHKCGCNRCYTFGLKSSNLHGNFDRAGVTGCFGGVLIVLFEDEIGNLKEFEIPDDEFAVPYADEYVYFDDENYRSKLTQDEAYLVVKQWFAEHPEAQIEQVVLDD